MLRVATWLHEVSWPWVSFPIVDSNNGSVWESHAVIIDEINFVAYLEFRGMVHFLNTLQTGVQVQV